MESDEDMFCMMFCNRVVFHDCPGGIHQEDGGGMEAQGGQRGGQEASK